MTPDAATPLLQASHPVGRGARARKKLLFIDIDAQAFIHHRSALARAAMDAGYEVHVAVPDDLSTAVVQEMGLIVHRSLISRGNRSMASELAAAWGTLALIRSLRPDLLHLRTLKVTIYGGTAARIARVPAVLSLISGMGSLWSASTMRIRVLRAILQPVYRFSLAHPRQIVACENGEDRSTLIRLGLSRGRTTVTMPGSGVDVQRYQQQPEPAGSTTIIMPCRMLWEKGVGVFVEAAHRLAHLRPAVRFVLVGGADPLSHCPVPLEQLKTWHDAGMVEWWGQRHDMVAVFAQAHIICLPSYYGEGIPMSLLEGMACGKPIITTDSIGCREACQHEVNGLLVPPRDAEALALAMRRLIDDQDLRQRLGRAGRRRAVAEFSQAVVIPGYLAHFAALLGDATAPAHGPGMSEGRECPQAIDGSGT